MEVAVVPLPLAEMAFDVEIKRYKYQKGHSSIFSLGCILYFITKNV